MKRLLLVLAVVACSSPAFANLLANGSFETAGSAVTNAAFWDTQVGAPVVASDWWGDGTRENWNSPPDGSYAYYLKGTWAGGPDYAGIWQRVDGGAPAQEYLLSGMFYTDGGFAATANQLKLEFFDSANNFLGNVTTNLVGNIPGSTWTPVTLAGTSPGNTARLQVVFEASGVGGGGVLGGDNFDLTAIPEPSVFAMIMMGAAGLLLAAVRKFVVG